MKSAFRATGIYPLDKEQGLKQIPGGVSTPGREEVYQRVSDTFIEQLQTQRYGNGPTRRGKKLRISPGKSYAQPTTSDAVEERCSEEEDDPDEGKN